MRSQIQNSMFYLCVLVFTGVLVCSVPASLAGDGGAPPGEKPPVTVFTRLDDAGEAADHEGADHVIVLEQAINRVMPTGVTYVDGVTLLKVLTTAGCRGQGVQRWHYDPQSSHVEVREVNIIRAGARIPVDVSGILDLPAPQAAIYWSDRIKLLQLPKLQVNDGIEVITYRKGFTYALLADGTGSAAGGAAVEGGPEDDRYIPPMPGEYFDIVLFRESVPVIEKRYVLQLPADKRLHAEVYNGPLYSAVTYNTESTEYSWWGLDLPARAREPRQPSASDYVPKVVMATVESWEAKSRWFFDVNRDQFEVTPAIQAKVDQILDEAGLKKASEEEKAAALLHWVAQNIRYSGQTMGEGEGFTLHPSQMIFEQRSGVCKDIAGMLVAMMRAANMDSYAAMTMAGSRIDLVPADQFNHCVTALKLEDGTFRMYDPTWVPYNIEIWSLLETEQHYLVGTPDGEFLSRIRYSPPEESPLNVKHNAKLDNDGTLSGTFEFTSAGAIDGRLRGIVSGHRRTELKQYLAGMLAPISPRVEDIRFKHHVADDFSETMWITVEYRIPRFALPVAGGFEFASPLMQVVLNDGSLFRAGASQWAEERDSDLLLYNTQLVDGAETIELPKGFALVDGPAPDAVDETYGAFSGSSAQDGRKLKITGRAEVRRRQIPPDGYPGFKAAMDAAQAWGEQIFRVEKGDR